MRFGRCLLVVCTLTFLSLVLPRPALAAASPAADGWALLWGNKFSAADQQFKNDVAHTPDNAAAWRGLGWASYYKDDTHAALADWSRAVQLAPTDWTTAGLWPMMCQISDENLDYTALDSAARVLAHTENVCPELRYSARLVLAQDADSIGSRNAGAKLRSAFGFITDWQVVGPFDNVSKSGFNKAFGPEKKIDLDARYSGVDDIALHWRKNLVTSRDGVCSVSGFVGDRAADVFYAATAVNVSSPVNAILRYDGVGASKIYINGRLCATDSLYSCVIPDIPDAHSIPVRLNAGWNVVLVKVADNETLPGDFRLRFTDQTGAPIAINQVDSLKANGAAITTAAAADPAVAQPDWLDTLIGTHVRSIEGAQFLAYYDDQVADYEKAEAAVRTELAADPNCAPLHWVLSQALSFDGLDDDSRSEREAARRLTHDIAQAELDAITSDHSKSPAAEKIKLLRALAHRFPASDDIAFELATELQANSMSAEGYALGRGRCVHATYGGPISRLTDLDDDGHDADLTHLLQAAAKTYPTSPAILASLAGMLSDQRKYDQAISLYRRCIALAPQYSQYYNSIADVYVAAGNKRAALTQREIYARLRPQDPTAESALGEAYQDAGQIKQAIAAYRVAIELDPSRTDLRDQIQILTGGKPVLQLAPPIAMPSADLLRAKPGPGAPSTDALIDEKREVVYPDYESEAEVHEVLRINDEAAADSEKTFTLERESSTTDVTLVQARLIKPDGKVEDHSNDYSPGDGADEPAVMFPSLSPGDIIDVTYRERDRPSGALSDQFWLTWYFAATNGRELHGRLVLITPKDMDYRFVSHGGAPKPTERLAGNWRIRQWDVVNGPVFTHGISPVPFRDSSPWVDVSTVQSWSTIVDWYRDLAKQRCVADDTIRAKAAEITKGLKTDDEKIAALVRYVSHDIEYQSTPFRMSAYIPTEGKEVIRERYGDCKDKAALLTAMLQSIGITSHMALVSPRSYGTTPYLPSPRFAHAIAVVDAPGGPLWVDGTADGLAYRCLPMADQGVPALIIRSDTKDLVTTPVLPPDSGMDYAFEGDLAPSGSLKGQWKLATTGSYAWGFRSLFKSVSDNKQDEYIRRLASAFSSAEYDSGSISNENDTDKPFVVTFAAHNDHFGTTAGSFLLMGLPWDQFVDMTGRDLDAIAAPNRVGNLDLSTSRWTNQYEITVNLPEHYVPQDLPANVSDKSEWGQYSFAYSVSGNRLTVNVTDTRNVMQVPVADIPKYVAFERQFIDQFDTKFVLKKS